MIKIFFVLGQVYEDGNSENVVTNMVDMERNSVPNSIGMCEIPQMQPNHITPISSRTKMYTSMQSPARSTSFLNSFTPARSSIVGAAATEYLNPLTHNHFNVRQSTPSRGVPYSPHLFSAAGQMPQPVQTLDSPNPNYPLYSQRYAKNPTSTAIHSMIPAFTASQEPGFQVKSTPEWMNSNFLMSVINNQAQQIQSLLQNYQLQTPFTPNGQFMPHMSEGISYNEALPSNPVLTTNNTNTDGSPMNTSFQRMAMKEEAYQRQLFMASHFLPRSKPTSTLIPQASYPTPQIDTQMSSQTLLQPHQKNPKLLVSLRDYTGQVSFGNESDGDNFENKATKVDDQKRDGVNTIKLKRNRRFMEKTSRKHHKKKVSMTKEQYKLPAIQDSMDYPILKRRLKKLKQRKLRRSLRQDPMYKPPHRISSMLFFPRLLPLRQRRAPHLFADVFSWDNLMLRTVIEKNSRYKTIQVLEKTHRTQVIKTVAIPHTKNMTTQKRRFSRPHKLHQANSLNNKIKVRPETTTSKSKGSIVQKKLRQQEAASRCRLRMQTPRSAQKRRSMLRSATYSVHSYQTHSSRKSLGKKCLNYSEFINKLLKDWDHTPHQHLKSSGEINGNDTQRSKLNKEDPHESCELENINATSNHIAIKENSGEYHQIDLGSESDDMDTNQKEERTLGNNLTEHNINDTQLYDAGRNKATSRSSQSTAQLNIIEPKSHNIQLSQEECHEDSCETKGNTGNTDTTEDNCGETETIRTESLNLPRSKDGPTGTQDEKSSTVSKHEIPKDNHVHFQASKYDFQKLSNPRNNTTVKFPDGKIFKVVKYVPPTETVKLTQNTDCKFLPIASSETSNDILKNREKKKYTLTTGRSTNLAEDSKWLSKETKDGQANKKFRYLGSFQEMKEDRKWAKMSRAKIFGEDQSSSDEEESLDTLEVTKITTEIICNTSYSLGKDLLNNIFQFKISSFFSLLKPLPTKSE